MNVIFDWIQNNFTVELLNSVLGWIVAIMLGWSLLKAQRYIRTLSQKLQKKSIQYDGEHFQGLIVSLGSSNALQKIIISKVNPQYLGIVTGNSAEVKESAKDLIDYALSKGIVCDEPHHYGELDIERIEKGFDDLTDWMIKKGITRSHIVIDLTGGKTPFSIAAFNSSFRNQINAVYTDSEYNSNKPVNGTQQSILLTSANI